jgi:hypothetical protein
MNVKKTLQNRIRGWFPKEPVLKAPLKTQIGPVNRSRSFKARRWLHGTSAFIRALWCQRSLRTKIGAVLLGVVIFLNFFLYFLITNNLVSRYLYNFGLTILPISYFALQWVVSLYFRRKEPFKNLPSENMNPTLRLGGTIICVIAVAVMAYSTYMIDFVYSNTHENPSTIPFYLGLVGLFVFLLGWGLFMLGRKRTKIIPELKQ